MIDPKVDKPGLKTNRDKLRRHFAFVTRLVKSRCSKTVLLCLSCQRTGNESIYLLSSASDLIESVSQKLNLRQPAPQGGIKSRKRERERERERERGGERERTHQVYQMHKTAFFPNVFAVCGW
jgi:hypothetical protein